MNQKLARQIVHWTIKADPVDALEEKVISYGIFLFLESIELICFFLIIGVVFGKGVEMMVALTGFGLLRSQARGVHCKEIWQCRTCMGMILATAIMLPEVFVLSATGRTVIYMLIVGILWTTAPANGVKIKIENKGIRRKKRNISLGIVLLAYLLSAVVSEKLAMTLMIALLFETLSLVVSSEL